MATKQLFCCEGIVPSHPSEKAVYNKFFNAFMEFAEDYDVESMAEKPTASITQDRYASEEMFAFQGIEDEEQPKPKYGVLFREQLAVGTVSRYRKAWFVVYRSESPELEHPFTVVEVEEQALDKRGFDNIVEAREYECKSHKTTYDVILYGREKKQAKKGDEPA